ncbi:hypothetical protein V6N13_108308 [Hibiscus sabdariffa]
MATFMRLEDSPMFQKQICSLEVMADDLKNRCQILYKGSKKFLTALVEAHNGENSFADSLEAFGSGMDDPVSLSVGGCQVIEFSWWKRIGDYLVAPLALLIRGPTMSRFIDAFRELASYKELLRSQVSVNLPSKESNSFLYN